MKKIFATLLLVFGAASVAHADISETYRPGRPPGRPAPYPGNPGRPGHPPRPNPGYPPPPAYYTEYLTCSSYNYGYQECYVFDAYRVVQVNVYRQHSYEPCINGRTMGLHPDRIWVSNGCSATFEIIRRR